VALRQDYEGMPQFAAGRNRMLTVLIFLREPDQGGSRARQTVP
jgi:hypothetical protein